MRAHTHTHWETHVLIDVRAMLWSCVTFPEGVHVCVWLCVSASRVRLLKFKINTWSKMEVSIKRGPVLAFDACFSCVFKCASLDRGLLSHAVYCYCLCFPKIIVAFTINTIAFCRKEGVPLLLLFFLYDWVFYFIPFTGNVCQNDTFQCPFTKWKMVWKLSISVCCWGKDTWLLF